MEWRRSGPDGICLLHNVVNFPRSWPDDGANVTGFKESHSRQTFVQQQHAIYANSTLACTADLVVISSQSQYALHS